MTTSCDKTKKEAEKVATLSYKLSADVPNLPELQGTKEDLRILTEVALSRSPRFSACGFFFVDNTTLSGILATFASYVFVMIQFNK